MVELQKISVCFLVLVAWHRSLFGSKEHKHTHDVKMHVQSR